MHVPAIRCNSCLGSYCKQFNCAGDGINDDESEFICENCMEYLVDNGIEDFVSICNFTKFNIKAARTLARQNEGSSEDLQAVFSSRSPYYRFAIETIDLDEDDDPGYEVIAEFEEAEIEEMEIDELPRPPREPAAPLNEADFAGMIDRSDMTDDQYARAIALLRYKDNLPQDEEEAIGESIFEICCVKGNILCVHGKKKRLFFLLRIETRHCFYYSQN